VVKLNLRFTIIYNVLGLALAATDVLPRAGHRRTVPP